MSNGTDRRIALFVPSMRGGGAERVMLTLATAFAARGVAVDLVLARAEGPYLRGVPPEVRVVDLGARRVLASVPPLARYLRDARPASILSTLVHANIAALWARRLARVRVRVVVREANTLSVAAAGSPRARNRILPSVARWCYAWADEVVAVSEGVARDLVATTRLPRERVRVVYSPVITADLPARARGPAPHAWLAPGEPPLVLGVGRLEPQKDFATLLRAFAIVRARRRARLLILGEGDERERLEALAGELGVAGDVALPGFVENPLVYMAHASLFALSSAWEGLPGALIQALACGTPVVATDCESGPREILQGGRYGRLAPPGHPTALAEAIEAELDHPTAGDRALAVAPFTEEASVSAYLRLLGHGAPDHATAAAPHRAAIPLGAPPRPIDAAGAGGPGA